MLNDYAALINNEVVHVATRDGRLVGLIVMWLQQDRLYVDNLAVLPEIRAGSQMPAISIRSCASTSTAALLQAPAIGSPRASGHTPPPRVSEASTSMLGPPQPQGSCWHPVTRLATLRYDSLFAAPKVRPR